VIPEVMIILGSGSDLEIAKKTMDVLEEFQIYYSLKIASAHRTHELLKDLVIEGTKKGVKVFIGIAGLAAHLPGVIASYTYRPVIGVPVDVKLSGLDALLASLQTPYPASVATIGINQGDNAGILAVEILSIDNEKIKADLSKLRKNYIYKIHSSEKEILANIDGSYFKDFYNHKLNGSNNHNDLTKKEDKMLSKGFMTLNSLDNHNDLTNDSPDVVVVLDSCSNIKVGENLIEILNKLEISHDFKIISSISDPIGFENYINIMKDAKLFVGVGGLSAHLTGSIVALSEKPVVGVPCSNQLNGLDALLSMVNMPPGVPVAAVGMDSGENGALLIVKILGIHDKRIETILKGEIVNEKVFK
jgi:5-(carboxyamino)imidazole ribonucleotide mutase